jgi:hypothetical protein
VRGASSQAVGLGCRVGEPLARTLPKVKAAERNHFGIDRRAAFGAACSPALGRTVGSREWEGLAAIVMTRPYWGPVGLARRACLSRRNSETFRLHLLHDSRAAWYNSSTMSTTELIDKIKTLPLEDRKEVLRILSEEFEEDVDAKLYDERTKEPDGRTLGEIRFEKKTRP